MNQGLLEFTERKPGTDSIYVRDIFQMTLDWVKTLHKTAAIYVATANYPF